MNLTRFFFKKFVVLFSWMSFDAMKFKICEKFFKMYWIDNKFNLIFLVLLFYLEETKNKMPNKTYFHKSWLSDSRFVEWIAHSKSKENAYCKICKCVISLSNMGEKALRSQHYSQ